MLLVAVAVHEHDRDRPVALVIGRLQIAPRAFDVQRHEHLAVRADALVDFDHLGVEQFGQDDVAVENARPVLVGDPQRVAEAARDEQHRALALALEQRIGRHRGAHLHRLDRLGRNRRPGAKAEQMADAGERGVAVAARVLGKQLVRDEPPSGRLATISVNVPPRSIQNCQRPALGFEVMVPAIERMTNFAC